MSEKAIASSKTPAAGGPFGPEHDASILEPAEVTLPHSCCAPTQARTPSNVDPGRPLATGGIHNVEQVTILSGVYQMGDSRGDRNRTDGEAPVHRARVDSFTIDATCVTNADFARFVSATGYETEAETFGSSAVFHLALQAAPEDVVGRAAGAPWWLGVRGADWRHPGGPLSNLDSLDDHPAVHVSWNDAQAYCDWSGRRLPTEAEWEFASRGGLEEARYPWGDELHDEDARWRCNIWQGVFPTANTQEDGWPTTAPVRAFKPNGFGLWQTIGNVWEWCSDWFDAGYYAVSPLDNPLGPNSGSTRVMRGGSFLCHDSYCNRYRNSARSSNTPESSTANVGFRTVAR